MEYKTLSNGFKGHIKKGETVEKWNEKHGVCTISNNKKVDYIMNFELEKNVSRETLSK